MQSESTYVLKTKALYKLVNVSLYIWFLNDLELPKSERNFLFTSNKLAVTTDHGIALLFNVSLRQVPLSTDVRCKSVSYHYIARKEQIRYGLSLS